MRANPGTYRTHAIANQGEAGIGLLVGLAVVAVGGIAYLVLKPSTTAPATAPAAAPAPAVSPAQTTAPAAPAAVSPSSNIMTLSPTKQTPHGYAHGLEWLA